MPGWPNRPAWHVGLSMKIHFGFLLITAIVLNSCDPTSPLTTSESSTGAITPETYSGGLRTRFESIPSQRQYASDEFPGAFQVQPGQPLEGEFAAINNFPDTKEGLLLLLLNYRQQMFRVNGEDALPFYQFTFGSGEQISFSLTTELLAEGYYDLAWVVIVDPYKADPDLLSRVRSSFSPVLRRSVYVGDVAPPRIAFQPFAGVTADSSPYNEALYITEREDRLGPWPEFEVRPQESVQAFLRFGVPRYEDPTDKKEVPMAFVAFMDYQQVPLGTDQPALFGLAKAGEIVTVPLTIAEKGEGTHFYFIHRFPWPYTPIMGETRGLQSQATPTVIIHVRK